MPPVARRHTGTGGFETRPYVASRLAGNTKPNPDPAGAGFRPPSQPRTARARDSRAPVPEPRTVRAWDSRAPVPEPRTVRARDSRAPVPEPWTVRAWDSHPPASQPRFP